MIGSKWVRDCCYASFGLKPDPADYGRPSKDEEPDLIPAESVRWRSFDLAECRDYGLGRALAKIMDQIAPRVKTPKDQLGDDYWRALARDAERGPPDRVEALRIEIAGQCYAPHRAVAAALSSTFRIPPNGRTLTTSDTDALEFLARLDEHKGREYLAEFLFVRDALTRGETVRLVYES